VTVERAKVDRAAGPATRTKDVELRRSSEQRRPDCRRPQHVAPGGEAPIPSVDHGFGFLARDAVRPELGGACLDVWFECPNGVVDGMLPIFGAGATRGDHLMSPLRLSQ
jgi:hypothetical protein